MIKDKVRKEICLLFAIALIVSLLSSQTAYAGRKEDIEIGVGIQTTESAVTDTRLTEAVLDDSVKHVSANEDLAAEDPVAEPPAADNVPAEDTISDQDPSGMPDVSVQLPDLELTELNLIAGGNPYELYVENTVSASYGLSEGSCVILSNETAQSVTITPIAPGHTVLSVTAVGSDGTQTILTCRITVSKLSLSTGNVDLYINDKDPDEDVIVQGIDLDTVYYGSGNEWEDETIRDAMDSGTQCTIRAGNPKVAEAYFSDGSIHIKGISKGITNIRLNIYGVPLSVRVIVHHYTLNKYTINTYKGSGIKNLKLKGAGSHKVTWVSGNKNVAAVSKTGIVSIKGIGTTKITAKVNGRKVACIVSVSSKTAYRVVKDARAITKKKNIQYSQALRMSKNYYDCSSLVYRCYRSYGIRFGYTNPSWAPTAADEAHWCFTSGHLVASQALDLLSCKLIPGDTIYYSFNGNNGRYLNIDHTAIFAGYSYDASIGYYGTVIEASSSSNTVTERMYYASDYIQMIGRPVKK